MNIDWIDEWLQLWPPDIRWNNERIRSTAKECQNKMEKWIKQYPEFDKQVIFKATENYLLNQELKQWDYTMKAHYFIDKKGKGSTLLEYCTALNAPQEEENPFYNDFI